MNRKIPKIIHYCWFGHGDIPKLEKACIESWKKYLPEYEIMIWNEENFDVNSIEYVRLAYEEKKYAFVSDYVRLHALYNYGGIYLDTDMELIKSLNSYINCDLLIGFGDINCISAGIIGSIKGSSIIGEIMNLLASKPLRKTNNELNPTIIFYINKVLKENGVRINNTLQKVNGITVYPMEYFYPIEMYNFKKNFSENTVSIHHYSGSWLSKKQKIKNFCYKVIRTIKRSIFK